MSNEVKVPYYAVHKDGLIAGFCGPFRFLSNFYPLENGIWFEELTYPSVEHAYQAAKWSSDQREQFLSISAGKAKALGQLAPNFDRNKWNKKKEEIMRSMNYQKYEKNFKLRKMLLETDGFVLEERNNWGDQFWGTNETGEGQNTLGKILMAVRNKFKELENKEKYW